MFQRPHEAALIYARADRAAAENLVTRLEELEFSVFWDKHLSPGAEWPSQLRKGIDDAAVTICLVSEASNASRQVVQEIAIAKRANNLVLVAIEKGVEPPWGYTREHMASLVYGDPTFEEALVALVAVVEDRNMPRATPWLARKNRGLSRQAEHARYGERAARDFANQIIKRITRPPIDECQLKKLMDEHIETIVPQLQMRDLRDLWDKQTAGNTDADLERSLSVLLGGLVGATTDEQVRRLREISELAKRSPKFVEKFAALLLRRRTG